MSLASSAFPSIDEVLPHSGRMILLSRIVNHGPDETQCEAAFAPGSPFVEKDGTLPAWVGIECMAQCIAAHAGLKARLHGESVRIGFLVGMRQVTLGTAHLRVGQILNVTAKATWHGAVMASFACRVADGTTGAPLIEGHLSVYLPTTLDPFPPGSRSCDASS